LLPNSGTGERSQFLQEPSVASTHRRKAALISSLTDVIHDRYSTDA
jgi:phenylpyruvate tautomerase PptA (4-oxalocrotonate tautomerase family)